MFNKFLYGLSVSLPKNINNFIEEKKPREKIYVVGNGWASYYFVKNLNKFKYEPIIIAPNSKVLNTPKLILRVMDENYNPEFPNPYAEKIEDMVEDIDINKKLLITKSCSQYPYTRVVFAIGSEPNDFGIKGVDEYTYKLKTIADTDKLRKQILNLFSTSKIFIVGSGPTGIELASKFCERNNLIKVIEDGEHQICGYDKIKIFEGLDDILPGFNSETKDAVRKYFENKRILDIKTSHMVKSISEFEIVMKIPYSTDTEFDNFKPTDTKFELFRPIDLIIWTGGVRFNGFGKTTLFNTLNKICQIKQRGIEVNKDFTIGNQTNVYCLGDMVANMGPPTAQNAKNQAIWLAKYFNSGFNNHYLETEPYKIKSKGRIIHLGNETYLESKYYTGFIPNIVGKIIEYFD